MNLKDHLLSRETVALKAHASDWRHAVKIGTDLLERAGTVTPAYYEEILKSTQEHGPYFLLAPGIAMPHARPEAGVLETSYALVTLQTPVVFGDPDNDPIDILITLAAADATTQNQEAIVQVVTLVDSAAAVAALRTATTVAELRKIFAEVG